MPRVLAVALVLVGITLASAPAAADPLRLAPRSLLAQEGMTSAPPPGYVPAPPGAYAPAPPPPSSGVGMIIAGSILLGVGVANLVTSPLCKTDAIRHDLQDTCLYASLGVGVALSGVGIPLVVVGANRRRAFRQWQQVHPVMAGLLEGVRISTGRGRGELLLGARF